MLFGEITLLAFMKFCEQRLHSKDAFDKKTSRFLLCLFFVAGLKDAEHRRQEWQARKKSKLHSKE